MDAQEKHILKKKSTNFFQKLHERKQLALGTTYLNLQTQLIADKSMLTLPSKVRKEIKPMYEASFLFLNMKSLDRDD